MILSQKIREKERKDLILPKRIAKKCEIFPRNGLNFNVINQGTTRSDCQSDQLNAGVVDSVARILFRKSWIRRRGISILTDQIQRHVWSYPGLSPISNAVYPCRWGGNFTTSSLVSETCDAGFKRTREQVSPKQEVQYTSLKRIRVFGTLQENTR
jgi:hypothetical protein